MENTATAILTGLGTMLLVVAILSWPSSTPEPVEQPPSADVQLVAS